MTSEDIDEAILASLKKLGPAAPRRIADDAGIDPAKVTYAGTRLRKAGLIKTAGATLNLVWALPEQKIEITVDPDRPAPRNKNANKKRKAKATPRKAAASRKPKRKYTRGPLRADAAQNGGTDIAAEQAALDAKDLHAGRQYRQLSSLDKLQIALDQHLAAVTDTRRKLFGSILYRTEF